MGDVQLLVHSNLLKNTVTGECTNRSLYCSQMTADFTSQLVIDMCMCGRGGGSGTLNAPLLKLTNSVVGHLWFGVEFV